MPEYVWRPLVSAGYKPLAPAERAVDLVLRLRRQLTSVRRRRRPVAYFIRFSTRGGSILASAACIFISAPKRRKRCYRA